MVVMYLLNLEYCVYMNVLLCFEGKLCFSIWELRILWLSLVGVSSFYFGNVMLYCKFISDLKRFISVVIWLIF